MIRTPSSVYHFSQVVWLVSVQQNIVWNLKMADHTEDLEHAGHISEIIVSCCQLNPPRNYIYEMAFQNWIDVVDNSQMQNICASGSCAEFYIDPAVMCISDTDLMYSPSNHIAVCVGSTFSYRDLDEITEVWKIEILGCPIGYVHLRLSRRLHFNWETDQFEYFVVPKVPEYHSVYRLHTWYHIKCASRTSTRSQIII